MAITKTIPELNEIDIGDVTVDQLMVLDTGLETMKVRLSTLVEFLGVAGKYYLTDATGWSGTEFQVEYQVDTDPDDNGGTVPNAPAMIWQLKRDEGAGVSSTMDGYKVTHDASGGNVTVTFGADFPPAAGTYYLVGR